MFRRVSLLEASTQLLSPCWRPPLFLSFFFGRAFTIQTEMVAAALILGLLCKLVAAQNNHESCDFWADHGECDANPGYMLVNCKTACNRVKAVPEVSELFIVYRLYVS